MWTTCLESSWKYNRWQSKQRPLNHEPVTLTITSTLHYIIIHHFLVLTKWPTHSTEYSNNQAYQHQNMKQSSWSSCVMLSVTKLKHVFTHTLTRKLVGSIPTFTTVLLDFQVVSMWSFNKYILHMFRIQSVNCTMKCRHYDNTENAATQ